MTVFIFVIVFLFIRFIGNSFSEISNEGKINSSDFWYTTPTISNEFPFTKSVQNNEAPFIYVHDDDYRQYEFLNSELLPIIEREFEAIRNVWDNHSKDNGSYLLFKNCYTRNLIGEPNIELDFEKLKKFIEPESTGVVMIGKEFLVDGFFLKTVHTEYFGININGKVTHLCISNRSQQSYEEIVKICKEFNIVFVNWFHCELLGLES